MSDANGLPSSQPGHPSASLHFWGTHGLFNKFWKKYDQLSRVSFNPLTLHTRLPSHLLASFSFERLKMVNGQPLIPVSLKYSMTDSAFIETEIDFLTAKVYKSNSGPLNDLIDSVKK